MQPHREPSDGQFTVERVGGKVLISVTTDDVEQTIVMGEFNAWRVFGTLAMFFGVRLPKKVAKAIQL